MDDTTDGPFPTTIMPAVLWAFRDGEQFTDAAAFNRRVSEYHVAIQDEDTWEPDEVVLEAPRLRVAWFGLESPDDDEYTDYTSELTADDRARFTAGELLRKLHNLAAPRLVDADHVYFEGLYLTDPPEPDDIPVYEMMQGS
jgi:hypothetical protein